jgi:hypothetical protein
MLLIATAFSSCDTGEPLLIDGNGVEKEIAFACGHISVSADLMSRAFPLLYFDFNLSKEVTVFRDSIVISYKGGTRPFSVQCSPDDCDEDVIELKGKGEMWMEIDLSRILPRGDTIEVRLSGFAQCEGQRVPLEHLYLVAPEE